METQINDILQKVSDNLLDVDTASRMISEMFSTIRKGTRVWVSDNIHGHGFDLGQSIILIDSFDKFWLGESISGERYYITEDEFIYIVK
jgi:hypothetical protein